MTTIYQFLEWIILALIGIFARGLYTNISKQERRIDRLENNMDVLREKQQSDVTLLETKIDSLRQLNEQKLSEILNLLELTREELKQLNR